MTALHSCDFLRQVAVLTARIKYLMVSVFITWPKKKKRLNGNAAWSTVYWPLIKWPGHQLLAKTLKLVGILTRTPDANIEH